MIVRKRDRRGWRRKKRERERDTKVGTSVKSDGPLSSEPSLCAKATGMNESSEMDGVRWLRRQRRWASSITMSPREWQTTALWHAARGAPLNSTANLEEGRGGREIVWHGVIYIDCFATIFSSKYSELRNSLSENDVYNVNKSHTQMGNFSNCTIIASFQRIYFVIVLLSQRIYLIVVIKWFCNTHIFCYKNLFWALIFKLLCYNS